MQGKALSLGGAGLLVIGVGSLALFGFFGEPSATMSTVHEDSKVSHGSVVSSDGVGVIYVWLGLDPGVVVDSRGGRVYRWNVSGNTFL